MSSVQSPGAADRIQAIPRSGIRRLLERVGSPDHIDLVAGDPSFGTPPRIIAAAKSALDEGATHYTHGRGIRALREMWVRKLATENCVTGLDPEFNTIVTAGALNALSATLLSIVNPGDRVLIPDPGFANYWSQIRLAGGTPHGVPFPFSREFNPDLNALHDAAPTARVMIINSPGNPTGKTLSRDVLQQIADIANQNNLLVISDEAYEHILYDDAKHTSLASLPGMAQRTLTISSMSKSWAMTGWRIGFVAGPAALIEQIAKVQEHLIGCPPAMTQWGALEALSTASCDRTSMVEAYAERREMVLETLSQIPCIDVVKPDGAFYVFPRFNISPRGEDLAEYLANTAGVLMVPGSAFGRQGDRHLRMSFAGPTDRLEEGLARLQRWGLNQ